jgi:exonuclease III
VRLATWNVNSLRMRLPRVLEFLAEHAPDVVCLQETKSETSAFPHAELAQAGYDAVDHSGGRWADWSSRIPPADSPASRRRTSVAGSRRPSAACA